MFFRLVAEIIFGEKFCQEWQIQFGPTSNNKFAGLIFLLLAMDGLNQQVHHNY